MGKPSKGGHGPPPKRGRPPKSQNTPQSKTVTPTTSSPVDDALGSKLDDILSLIGSSEMEKKDETPKTSLAARRGRRSAQKAARVTTPGPAKNASPVAQSSPSAAKKAQSASTKEAPPSGFVIWNADPSPVPQPSILAAKNAQTSAVVINKGQPTSVAKPSPSAMKQAQTSFVIKNEEPFPVSMSSPSTANIAQPTALTITEAQPIPVPQPSSSAGKKVQPTPSSPKNAQSSIFVIRNAEPIPVPQSAVTQKAQSSQFVIRNAQPLHMIASPPSAAKEAQPLTVVKVEPLSPPKSTSVTPTHLPLPIKVSPKYYQPSMADMSSPVSWPKPQSPKRTALPSSSNNVSPVNSMEKGNSDSHKYAQEETRVNILTLDDSILVKEEDIAAPVKRKPGRPPKVKTPGETPKRGRGRPRKSQVAEDSSLLDEDAVYTPVAKTTIARSSRGRQIKPVKSFAQPEVKKESGETDGPRIKARTPGYQQNPDKVSFEALLASLSEPEAEVDPSISTVCFHCGEDCRGLQSLQLHLMEQHHRIWEAQRPEGFHRPAYCLKALGEIKCLKCGAKFRGVPTFFTHEKWCGREEEKVTCELCGEEMLAMKEEKHKKKCKPKEEEEEEEGICDDGDGSESRDSEVKLTDCEESSDDDDDLEDFDEDDKDDEAASDDTDVTNDDRRCKTHLAMVPPTARALGEEWPFYSIVNETDMKQYSNVYDWMKEHKVEMLFEDWMPGFFEILSDVESMEGQTHTPLCGTAVTGGNIWRTEWCPMPLDSTDVQYLAVSHGETYEAAEKGSIIATGAACNRIQIWRLGELNTGMESNMELCYVISVEGKRIWDMKWCATGAYQPSQRLGLIAVASSDGFVRILSVPPSNEAISGRLLKLPTSCILSASDSNVPHECLCLDWSLQDECGTVCAGYDDGLIAVWYLHVSSSLLRSENLLFASRVFQAHLSPVKSLSIFPNVPHYIVSAAAASRDILVWDLQDPSAPLHEYLYYRAVSACWPFNWSTVLVGTDFFEVSKGNPVLQLAVGFESDINPLFQNASCFWSVAHSPWLNSVIACNNDGFVSLIMPTSPIGRVPVLFTKKFRLCWRLDAKNSLQKPEYADCREITPKLSNKSALHCVRWNPNNKCARWVACGGSEGKLFVKKVTCKPKQPLKKIHKLKKKCEEDDDV
ncbi:hypothetical protein CAPTEDRAFT_228867 [Capitella teleta]|uniref:Uncharacterized protein n=1 Tax=Capitella teleta TaxID=283909 RepID=R7T4Z5_CAPTE|nr:hypothetical protein CAPTEDRAFT_228867 [Capitella teleta]|eukprot:ELT88202.1 hypothetical protein CAPTEDRAFT_228867 [Capitella teleta]